MQTGIVNGAGLGAGRPTVASVDPGRITHPLFNRLWAHTDLAVLVEPGHVFQYDQHLSQHAVIGAGSPEPSFLDELGACVQFTRADGDFLLWSGYPTSSAGDWTLACVFQTISTLNQLLLASSSLNSGFALQLINTGFLRFTKGAVVDINTGLAYSTGVPYAYIASYRASDGALNFTACRLDTGAIAFASTTNTSSPANNSGSRVLGGNGVTTNDFNGHVAAAYIGNVFLSPEEQLVWALDPFGMWREDEFYILPYRSTAGGGSAKPWNHYQMMHRRAA